MKINQNEQLLQLFIKARSNITVTIWKCFTQIRTTEVSHKSNLFSLVFDGSFLLSDFSVAFLEKNEFSTLYSSIIFLTRNSDFECFN